MTKHFKAVRFAWNGIVWGLKTQPNYRVHILLSLITVLAGYYYGISYEEWLTVIVMMFLGFVIETVNTAIEKLGDSIDTKFNEHIKLAKDSGAGAMLIFSFGAAIIAAIIFLPKIF
ncbi:hypothetical protein A3A93_02270 [Candidatus Roizmanbacteria bacterium RIFCSPLOWO2_01_FULL_38_12]|uniref:Diacylglycerol kinase n=1 Tax=Candidatus Roizmanbacteria bacterium RIFCSPLOWO2_01_FULL_38_12 TaxID=1802061 RepID=A0A1F7IWL4_9BACT|nr:MAG: hypothetical protein A3F59_05185 [Candidatus Roizmanbacteria bacterium RIFCSPHIGHO2_12_FULL_38_13]OGK47758.1 MAG: hypothetical protein A3A93_02270 [Candidatus Roizmanbacteria bacterium RIFCSPLOWO2_01_FULL_38_12]